MKPVKFILEILAFLGGTIGVLGVLAWILVERFRRWYSPFHERVEWCSPLEFWTYSAITSVGLVAIGLLVFVGIAALWQTLTSR